MGKIILSISVSLDGFVAGPSDRPDQPLGEGGDVLHEWITSTDPADREILDGMAETGALLVGRRMFDLSAAWNGDPPGGLPCFVLTHRPPDEWTRPGSPFTFVTDGIESAVEQARRAAGDRNVGIGGGADTSQQALRAGLVEEIQLQLVPVLLGGGVRLFERMDTAPVRLERIGVTTSPYATHLRLRVITSTCEPGARK
jgi:dihydrofolate reductase